MFDIGFFEILLLLVLGLLILGPERLPVAIRTVIVWWKRLFNTFESARQQVQEEINYAEMSSKIDNYKESIKDFTDDLTSADEVDKLNEQISLRHAQSNSTKARKAPAKKTPGIKKTATKKTSTRKTTTAKQPIAKPATKKASPAKSQASARPKKSKA